MTPVLAPGAHAEPPHIVRRFISLGQAGSRAELRRHNAAHPCPVCGGYAALPQHRGVRCAGFSLDRVAYCTREEHAGPLPFDMTTSPGAYKHQLFGPCGCGTSHGWQAILRPPRVSGTQPATTPLSLRNDIYACALGLLTLRPEALADLTARGLSEAAAVFAGYRSIPRRGLEHQQFIRAIKERFDGETLRACPGFTDKNGRLGFWTASGDRDGYVVPYRDEAGRLTGLQLKLLDGRYLTARNTRLGDVYAVAGTTNVGCDLYLTEGATKAIVTNHLAGLTVFAVAGQSLAPSHVDAIRRLRPSRVIVALDHEDNQNTDRARTRWVKDLHEAGLPVHVAVWEGADVGRPKGLDDLVLAGERPRVRAVAVAPSAITERRTPRAVPEAGPIDAGGTLAEARELTGASVRRFIRERRAGEALLVSTPPGAGKTKATADAIVTERVFARIVAGTRGLAAELALAHGYTLIEGRNPDNCERIDVVDALAADGHDVEELACGTERQPRCPVRDRCRYWRQFDAIGTRVAAAEQLFNPRFLAGGQIVVADDADLLRSVVERTYIAEDALARAHAALAGKRRIALRRLVDICSHAVIDARAATAPLIGAAAWDHLARTARRNGVDLGALIASLPVAGTLPQPGKKESVLTTVDVQAAAPASLLVLVDALRQELQAFKSGEDFNSRIRIEGTGIDAWRLRTPATDRFGSEIVAELPLLVLEATPVPALVDHLTRKHERLPDVIATIALPANVTVIQHAGSPNGRTALRDPARLHELLAEVSAERGRAPALHPQDEAAVCFKSHRQQVIDAGFAAEQVLTFGAVRGSNMFADVERLHVVGRPMAPAADITYLAQVVHHDEAPISAQLELQSRQYGGQPYEVDVVAFADARAQRLLEATRDDEIIQVIHRARLLTLDPQGELFGGGRRQVRLVLHTGHPVPGLRVDELHVHSMRADVNAERREDAERRILAAADALNRQGGVLTVSAIAAAASADKRTVTRVLGTPVDTSRHLSNEGLHRTPQSEPSPPLEVAVDDGVTRCAGGCGVVVAYAGAKCSPCAAAAVELWKQGRHPSARARRIG